MGIIIPRNGYPDLWITKINYDISELRSIEREQAAQQRRKKLKNIITEKENKKSGRSKAKEKSKDKLKALREQRLQKRAEELRPFQKLPMNPQPAPAPSTWLLGAAGMKVWWISRKQWVAVVSVRKAYSAVEVFAKGQKDGRQYLIPDWDLATDDKPTTGTKR